MLLDTSGIFCLLHEAEVLHPEAKLHYGASQVRVTHNYVLAEFVALATTRGVIRQKVLHYLFDLAGNPDIEVVWIDPALHAAAMDLLQRRLDKTYSLCDAVSFVVMRARRIQQALTTDRHFDQEGFQRLLVP
jgi:predicted nucleic acid-binding protein